LALVTGVGGLHAKDIDLPGLAIIDFAHQVRGGEAEADTQSGKAVNFRRGTRNDDIFLPVTNQFHH
jgi:hypothetical protein